MLCSDLLCWSWREADCAVGAAQRVIPSGAWLLARTPLVRHFSDEYQGLVAERQCIRWSDRTGLCTRATKHQA